ncbi:OmpP1/FadL family transporter [Fodinibius halophilus]|uniref:Transporter n=1 Tax=Fodinibius halophilus TaxID=1736908 RepID=A0A6M1T834_9BACT|nr:OmpP1/FadL family transporter [Fodinibius halophilus]NGP89605.1 transporter [Fodinibius halophilus]
MRRLIATICLIFLCSGSALASGFSIYEASVRANGMLGAFSAYADHVSTIYYNPAGLGGMDGLRVSGGATIIAPRSTFRNLSSLAPRGQKTSMEKQNFLVPNFYGSYQVTDKLTAGIGVYAPFGLGTKWPSDWVGRGSAIETSIETIFVSPSVGYQLPDFGIGKIKIGAGVRIAAHGEVKLQRAVASFSPEGTFTLNGELEKPAYGYHAGILYEPVKDVTLGFTYRSEVTTTFEGDATFENLNVGFPSEAKGSAEITMPSSYVIALNVKPIDGLSTELDYVWWGWSSYDELAINFDQSIPALGGSTIVNERNYNNSWQLRFGAEYTKIGVEGLTLRGGIAYDENPIKDRYVDPTLPDSDRWLFSGGVSYNLTDYLAIDAAYIFIRANQRKVTNTHEGGIDGVYTTYANLPSLGFTLNL